jgi:hypothetical protein
MCIWIHGTAYISFGAKNKKYGACFYSARGRLPHGSVLVRKRFKWMRRSEVPKNLLLDSGFWYALYVARDPFHEQANTFPSIWIFIPW